MLDSVPSRQSGRPTRAGVSDLTFSAGPGSGATPRRRPPGPKTTGDLIVQEGARFIGFNNTIAGDVLGQRARQVDFRFGRVGGGVRISGGIGASPVGLDYVLSQLTMSAGSIHIKQVASSNIHVQLNVLSKGSIAVDQNDDLGLLNIQRNDLSTAGHIHIFHNTARVYLIAGNTARGNIHCRGNAPPFVAAGNASLEGRLMGQCATEAAVQ
jgi:hypothetical protein